jgi:hypothetical protein
LFRTGIESGPFYGSDVTITGAHRGAAITFGCAAERASVAVSYTGKLEDGRMETLWFVVDERRVVVDVHPDEPRHLRTG